MSAVATGPHAAPPRPQQGPGPPPPAAPTVPFVNASHEHVEVAFQDAQLLAAGSLEKGPFEIPSSGYMRHIILEVNFSGGVLGAGVLAADFPWNVFERVTLADVNGSPLVELDGYALLQANIAGGYAYNQDPRSVDFDGTINGRFYLRVPCEINHYNGLGAIANQNSAQSYKLGYRLRALTGAGNSGLFTTAPTTAPTITVKAYLEAWTLPNEVDFGGRAQEQVPPLHGTSQYLASNSKGILAGANTLGITKVGNLLRNIIFVARDAAGLRSDAVFPDPISLQWDGNTLTQESQRGHIIRYKEKLQAIIAGVLTRDVGVFCFPYANSELGRNGDGPLSMVLGTLGSSRLEVQGNSALAGSIQVIVNDIAPVEINPAERYETPSQSGYAPAGAGGYRLPVGIGSPA